jgi:hypothetical protein
MMRSYQSCLGCEEVCVRSLSIFLTVFSLLLGLLTMVGCGGNQSSKPPVIVPVANTAPMGRVEVGATGSPTVPQYTSLSVVGWAADAEDGAPVSKVQILIDDVAVGDASLGGSRPDVATSLGSSAYMKSGWELEHNVGAMAPGAHNVTAVAHDSAGASTMIGRTTITVLPNSAPIGEIDRGVTTVAQYAELSIGGWAADAEEGAPVKKVQILLDDVSVGDALLGGSRPDVATKLGNTACTKSGWQLLYNVGAVASGTHTITAVAYDSAGQSTSIGRRAITVTRNTAPVGALETADASGATTVAQYSDVTVIGWAADAEDGSPVKKVQVLVDGVGPRDAVLGGVRMDVAAAQNNTAYKRSGWQIQYNVGGVSAGTHTVTAVAYDSAGASSTLGQKSINVQATAAAPTETLVVGPSTPWPNGTVTQNMGRYEAFPNIIIADGKPLLWYRSATYYPAGAPDPATAFGCHAGAHCRGIGRLFTFADEAWTAYSGVNQCQPGDNQTYDPRYGGGQGCLVGLPDLGGHALDVRTGAAGVNPQTGTAIVCAFVNDTVTRTDNGVLCSRSRDQGASWSTFTYATTTYHYTAGPLVYGTDSTGPYTAVLVSDIPMSHTYLLYSYDDGLTWPTARLITQMPKYPGIYEGACGDNGTHQFCILRNGGYNYNPMSFCWSSDQWTTTTCSPTKFTFTDPGPGFTGCGAPTNVSAFVAPWLSKVTDSGGKWLLTYAERQQCSATPSTWVIWGAIKGVVFDPEAVIANVSAFGLPSTLFLQTFGTNAQADFGYPSTAEVSPGQFLVTYYGPEQLGGVPGIWTSTLTVVPPATSTGGAGLLGGGESRKTK